MQISSSLPSLTPAQLSKADKVVAEFKQVEADVIAVDNDKIDLNSNEGEVKLDFTPLKPNAREKFTGEVTYNKDTKEAEDTHITKDCTDNNGRSIVKYKYDKYQLKNGNTLYIKEETTKGIYDSFYKKQERICVDQNGKFVEKPERITEDDYPRVLINNTSIKW